MLFCHVIVLAFCSGQLPHNCGELESCSRKFRELLVFTQPPVLAAVRGLRANGSYPRMAVLESCAASYIAIIIYDEKITPRYQNLHLYRVDIFRQRIINFCGDR